MNRLGDLGGSSARDRNRGPLSAVLVANAISVTGNRMVLLAIPWFVLETTGSPVKTGLAGFFTFLPVVAAGFLGPIVDRMGLKRASIAADLASGLSVAAIPLLFNTIGLEFWQLLVLVFLGGLLDSPGETARSSLLPETAEAAKTTLERATSLEDGIMRAASLVGAPLAGLLITLIGASNVLWVDAATFGVSALLVLVGVPRDMSSHEEASTTYWRDFREGFAFIRGRRLMMLVILTLAATNLLDAAIGAIVLPVYARQIFDSAIALGVILGALGGGAVVGSFMYGAWGKRFSRRWVYVVGFVLIAAQPWFYAAFPPLAIVVLVAAVAGLGTGPINPILAAVLLEQVPGPLRGRVLGVVKAIAWMAVPLGVLAGGYLVGALGLRSTLLVIAVAYVFALVSLAFNPAAADLERVEPVPGSGGQVPAPVPSARTE
jgi:MFS family permease